MAGPPPPPPPLPPAPVVSAEAAGRTPTVDEDVARPRVVQSRRGGQVTWTWMRASYSHHKWFELDIAGEPVRVLQQPELHVTVAGSAGGTVWDTSITLCKYLEQLGAEHLAGKRCIELGAGVGLVGVTAWKLGAQETILTELPAIMPLVDSNVRHLNALPEAQRGAGILAGRELTWGGDVQALQPPFDVVLGAEVTVEIFAADDLLQSLRDLTNKDSVVYLAHEYRTEKGNQFYAMAEQYFTVNKVPRTELHPVFKFDDADIYILRKK